MIFTRFFRKRHFFIVLQVSGQNYDSISTFCSFLSFSSQIYNSKSTSSCLFSIEFGHQSSVILTLFCRHRPFFVICSFSSQKYYSISAYIFYLCCFQAKRTIVYRLTLLILQHKYGHENIVILALFLSKMAVFV